MIQLYKKVKNNTNDTAKKIKVKHHLIVITLGITLQKNLKFFKVSLNHKTDYIT